VNLEDKIVEGLSEGRPLKGREIAAILSSKHGIQVDKSEINSILYRKLRNKAEQNKNCLGLWRRLAVHQQRSMFASNPKSLTGGSNHSRNFHLGWVKSIPEYCPLPRQRVGQMIPGTGESNHFRNPWVRQFRNGGSEGSGNIQLVTEKKQVIGNLTLGFRRYFLMGLKEKTRN